MIVTDVNSNDLERLFIVSIVDNKKQ